MPGAPLTLEGVVVRLRDYRESDRIVELMTAEEGRLPLIARGGRASRKRFVGALDLFVGLRVEALPRGNLGDLKSAVILDARLGIRADLDRLWRASLLVECACALTPERQEAGRTYRTLVAALDAIARGELAAAAAAYPRFLDAAGLLPSLRECGRCGAQDRPLAPLLSLDGVRCTTCAPGRGRIATEVVEVLRGGACGDQAVAAAVEECVAELIEAHIGRRLRSRGIRRG